MSFIQNTLLCNCIPTVHISNIRMYVMPLKSVLHLFQLSYPTFINTNRLLATNFEDVIIAPLSMIMKNIPYTTLNRIEMESTAEYINDMYFSHLMHSTVLCVIKIIRSYLWNKARLVPVRLIFSRPSLGFFP